jgi:hypothetical protein
MILVAGTAAVATGLETAGAAGAGDAEPEVTPGIAVTEALLCCTSIRRSSSICRCWSASIRLSCSVSDIEPAPVTDAEADPLVSAAEFSAAVMGDITVKTQPNTAANCRSPGILMIIS